MAVNNQILEEVYQQALKLPLEERKILANKLLESPTLSQEEQALLQLEAAGLLVPFPEELEALVPPVEDEHEDRLIHVKGKPVSETIIEDRR